MGNRGAGDRGGFREEKRPIEDRRHDRDDGRPRIEEGWYDKRERRLTDGRRPIEDRRYDYWVGGANRYAQDEHVNSERRVVMVSPRRDGNAELKREVEKLELVARAKALSNFPQGGGALGVDPPPPG